MVKQGLEQIQRAFFGLFDGSTAVLFLRRIKENIETWDWAQELA